MMRLRSACKINLTLDVLSRREDGYHELQSVVHTVALCDELEFDFSARELSLSCDVAELQSDDNLVLRAARLWQAETGHDGGCRIALQKRVPSGANIPKARLPCSMPSVSPLCGSEIFCPAPLKNVASPLVCK